MADAQTPHTPESWGAATEGYSRHVGPLMGPFAEPMIDRLQPDSRDRVLEVGAGTGVLTGPLARRVESLTAIDFAPRMIAHLEEELASGGVENVDCRVMDGQDLSFEPDTFDGAASSFAIMLFPDRVKGFSEMARVTKPGARCVVSAWAGPDRFEVFRWFLAALDKAFPDFPPPPSPPAVFSLADPARFREEMEQGGLEEVTVEPVAHTMEHLNRHELWAMATSGAPPARRLLDQIGKDGEDHLRNTYLSLIGDLHGDQPVRMVNTAMIATGRVGGR